MWHLGKVSDDKISLDIFTESKCELGLMSTKCNILEDFLDAYGITFFIWNFDANESKPWNRSLDTDRFCFECQCEIFFERLDLG
jgi:hypothetical protein